MQHTFVTIGIIIEYSMLALGSMGVGLGFGHWLAHFPEILVQRILLGACVLIGFFGVSWEWTNDSSWAVTASMGCFLGYGIRCGWEIYVVHTEACLQKRWPKQVT